MSNIDKEPVEWLQALESLVSVGACPSIPLPIPFLAYGLGKQRRIT